MYDLAVHVMFTVTPLHHSLYLALKLKLPRNLTIEDHCRQTPVLHIARGSNKYNTEEVAAALLQR